MKGVVASIILGGNDFIEMIKDRYLGNKKVGRDIPALRELIRGPAIEEMEVRIDCRYRPDPVDCGLFEGR